MLDVSYVQASQLSDATRAKALGIIGFDMPPSQSFAVAGLPVLNGSPLFEIWTSDLPVEKLPAARIDGAHDGEMLFGALTIAETPDRPLDAATRAAYLELFDHLEVMGYPHLIRVYHYLPRITQDEAGVERFVVSI